MPNVQGEAVVGVYEGREVAIRGEGRRHSGMSLTLMEHSLCRIPTLITFSSNGEYSCLHYYCLASVKRDMITVVRSDF